MAKDIHKMIGIFLIIIGIVPFLGISFGMLNQIVHVLTVAAGLVILATR